MNLAASLLGLTLMLVTLTAGAMGMTDSIQKAKARHEAELLATPGVVSVGIGQAADGEPAIIIGVQSDTPAIRQSLPQKLDGYPVEIQTLGTIRPQ